MIEAFHLFPVKCAHHVYLKIPLPVVGSLSDFLFDQRNKNMCFKNSIDERALKASVEMNSGRIAHFLFSVNFNSIWSNSGITNCMFVT